MEISRYSTKCVVQILVYVPQDNSCSKLKGIFLWEMVRLIKIYEACKIADIHDNIMSFPINMKQC